MGYTGETCDGEDVPDVRAYGNTPLPQTIELSQNYPNPFNPSTTIEFSLPHSQDVQLTVYNIKGQRVATLVDGICAEGINRVTFDTNVGAGLRPLTSGIYIYRLVSGDDIVTRKMIIVR